MEAITKCNCGCGKKDLADNMYWDDELAYIDFTHMDADRQKEHLKRWDISDMLAWWQE